MFGDVPPIGRHFLIGEKALYEVIGVVEDGKYDSLTESPKPAMFFPVAQYADSDVTLIVRSALPAAEVGRDVARHASQYGSQLAFHGWQLAGCAYCGVFSRAHCDS